MTDKLPNSAPLRKVLSARLKSSEQQGQPCFVGKTDAVYMVWCDGGGMPVRVYRDGEKHLALHHAKQLTESVGQRFHVLRSYRAFDPLPQ